MLKFYIKILVSVKWCYVCSPQVVRLSTVMMALENELAGPSRSSSTSSLRQQQQPLSPTQSMSSPKQTASTPTSTEAQASGSEDPSAGEHGEKKDSLERRGRVRRERRRESKREREREREGEGEGGKEGGERGKV